MFLVFLEARKEDFVYNRLKSNDRQCFYDGVLKNIISFSLSKYQQLRDFTEDTKNIFFKDKHMEDPS